MSESTWGDADSTPPPKKKTIPTWLWFCGGGCLLAVILAIAGGAWVASRFSGATDPEKQWPKVAEILPFDQRPSELELKFGLDLGMQMYYFDDRRGYMAVLMHMGLGGRHERDQFMNPDGGMGRKEAQAGKITVQGRELDLLRFQHMGKQGDAQPGTPEVNDGPAVFVDLTPEGASGFTILQLVSLRAPGPIADEVIQEFLKPFHVGPVR